MKTERPAGRLFHEREHNDGTVYRGVIDEARKDGVTYIYIAVDADDLKDPIFKSYTQLVARLRDVTIADPQVGQVVNYQLYIDDSGSKMAFNVVAA
jgi:hypothetical protein